MCLRVCMYVCMYVCICVHAYVVIYRMGSTKGKVPCTICSPIYVHTEQLQTQHSYTTTIRFLFDCHMNSIRAAIKVYLNALIVDEIRINQSVLEDR